MNSTAHKAELLAKSLGELLTDVHLSFVISDPREPDNAIVFASDGFYQLTGYSPSEVLGKNCRFLQGRGTSRQSVLEIRSAIAEERSTTVSLLNYRKDGTPFWNSFHLSPIRAADGVVEYFIGIQIAIREDLDAAAVESLAQEELQAAETIKHHVDAKLQAIKETHSPSCAADHSIPSCLLCGIGKIQECFVLCDPNLPDCPMVYASPKFLEMTQYSCKDLLGRNCRMLQGPDTDMSKVAIIKDAVTSRPPKAVTVTLLNYKKNGEPFFNCLHLAPVRDAHGGVRFFVGVQMDVTKAAAKAGLDAGMIDFNETSSTEGMGDDEERIPSAMMLLRQKGVVGALRVATRSLSEHGLRRAPSDQHAPTSPR